MLESVQKWMNYIARTILVLVIIYGLYEICTVPYVQDKLSSMSNKFSYDRDPRTNECVMKYGRDYVFKVACTPEIIKVIEED